MTFPPSIARVRVQSIPERKFGLWLPLFFLWPVFLLLWVFYPLLLLAAVILWRTPAGRPLLFGLPLLTGLFCAGRGLLVEVNDDQDAVCVKIF